MAIKLLVADDAPFIRELVRQAVRPEGIKILAEARDGEEAVNLSLKLRPDVILMDLVMPEMNGLDACRKIVADWPEARIIGFSTIEEQDVAEQALAAGCRHFLPKPFEGPGLIKAITGVLDSKQ